MHNGTKAKSRFSLHNATSDNPLTTAHPHRQTHCDPCEPPQPLTFPANPCPLTLSCKQVEAGEVAVVGGILFALISLGPGKNRLLLLYFCSPAKCMKKMCEQDSCFSAALQN